MKLIIKNVLGETFDLNVEPTDHIIRIKNNKQLQNKFLINERLIYAGNELENLKTLQDYEIPNESILYLVTRERKKVIFIKHISGKVLTIPVESSNTIYEIKEKIQEAEKTYLIDQQRIIYRGAVLENNKTLEEYDCPYESTLHLIMSLQKYIPQEINYSKKLQREPQKVLFVKTLTDKTVTIAVDLSDTILEVKKKVHDIECVPIDQQRMLFAGRELENDKTIEELRICYESTLHLVLRLRGGMYHETSSRNAFDPNKPYITLYYRQDCSDKMTKINLSFNHTIGDIKSILPIAEKIDVENKNLYLNGNLLLDTNKLSEIVNTNSVDIFLR